MSDTKSWQTLDHKAFLQRLAEIRATMHATREEVPRVLRELAKAFKDGGYDVLGWAIEQGVLPLESPHLASEDFLDTCNHLLTRASVAEHAGLGSVAQAAVSLCEGDNGHAAPGMENCWRLAKRFEAEAEIAYSRGHVPEHKAGGGSW
jgi:hypothetical protein